MYSWFTDVKLGVWWAAICPFFAGIFGIMTNNRCVVVSGCVFSVLGIIIGVIGTAVDSIASAIFAAESGCVNNETGEVYGTSDGKTLALDCSYQYSASSYYYSEQYQCICAGAGASCYYYDLTKGDNCGSVLSTYTQLISASAVMSALITLTCFIYSVLTCVVVCGPSTYIPPPSVQMADDPHMYSQVEMMSTHGTSIDNSTHHPSVVSTMPSPAPSGAVFVTAAPTAGVSHVSRPPPQQLIYNPMSGSPPVVYVLATPAPTVGMATAPSAPQHF